jgi:hypothetical protein
MNSVPLSPSALIRQLRVISLHSGTPFCSGKIKLLNRILKLNNCSTKDILVHHDTLLSLLAWPENKKIFELAKKAMNQLTTAVKEKVLHDKSLEANLSGTGIAGTDLTGRFSYAITRWLVNEFGNSVEFHSSEANTESVKLLFRQLVPAVEYETISSGELNLLHRIRKLKKKSRLSDLKWLVGLFEASDLSSTVKEFLFNELNIFVTWKLDHPVINRSFISIPYTKIFYSQKLNKVPDIKKILEIKLPSPALLSSKQKQQLVNVAKATLVFLYRETDPFSYAADGEVKLFNLEKGYSIGLYSMKTEHRLSIESYVGYLVFKNGIPVAYGGGWIFGDRCQFGINILEPFRGGESSYIFSQLIRVYYQYFRAKCFVVKPYQFGKKNKEALQSGAFWFYYKHGFHPEDELLQKLAGQEWEKKKADKRYRTSIGVLKKFTTSNMVLQLSKSQVPHFDASSVSQAITDFINKTFKGNRALAIKVCDRKTKKALSIKNLRSWSHHEKNMLQQWSLLVQATLSLNTWSDNEKKQLVNLIKAKGNNDELNFIKLLQKQQRFWKDLTGKFK